jgi:hypothetical protein
MAGYGLCGNAGPGLKDTVKPPKLLVTGVDIEVNTHATNGETALPYDIRRRPPHHNLEQDWYPKAFKHVCICMYADDYTRKIK